MATTAKDQAQPEAGHEDPIDPAACPSPAPTPAQSAPGGENLQDVEREVKQLQDRLHGQERRGEGTAPGVYSDPDHAPSHVNLQEILPRIKDLAQCVGGMKELAQIVTTLAQSKE